jgi:DNA polymerase (family 10)
MAEARDADDVSAGASVAAVLSEIGALLALEPPNRFRAQAYERAAGIVAAIPDLAALVHAGKLTGIPGIGAKLAGTIEEILRTGRAEILERLRARYPPGAAELGRVTSLARVKALHDALGVTTLDELRAACEAGRVRSVRGFGEKAEQQLVARIEALAARRDATTIAQAVREGDQLREHFARHPAVAAVEVAGAVRRRLETIDVLDLVIATTDPASVRAHAEHAPRVLAVAPAEGDGFTMERAEDLDVHVRIVPPEDFAVALIAATGSDAHTAHLVQLADAGGHALAAGAGLEDEDAVYRRLGLQPIPPELRDDTGEIEAAAGGRLPDDLVRLEDLRGVVHCHTVHSDGQHTVEEMARAAEALGLCYLTITDHSTSATYANGLDEDRLRRQWDEIERVQERVTVRLLRGTESDILRDGALDFPDAVLRRLDVVIASIHNRFGMNADEMTRRLVRAFQHPVTKIWGHALGRYVLSRPPFACHLDEVLDAAAATRTIVEVNGDPNRLDLAPEHVRRARERGLRFVVSADAHSTTNLRNLRWGVDMARRGWLRRSDVLNTLDADAFAAAVRP